ncbi:uncharacterized protein LOC131315519 [Rhododendron vialii]|uniref:uncharacterized protein LOC131315519 n=1 Tax=Rhododendron vialii TaxID=182163 RepID=UPI00265E0BC2|nr:uncharacterized protein LOC131315519 [Rhododendron vialii]
MAAPTNSGESDMAIEELYSDFSFLLYPTFSPPCLTPLPPLHVLPSSSSIVIYQGSNQSMDDPTQNQEHEDIVDPALYLAGDSVLLQQQQQLRQNWSEASDWRPTGGIMTMNVLELQSNNQGFEESNMGFEEESEEMSCFYFPPSSPTYFPLYPPVPSVFFVSTNIQDISLAFSYQHILEDKSGALHVINWEESDSIFALHVINFVSYLRNKFGDLDQIAGNKFGDLDQIARAPGVVVPKGMESLVHNILKQENYDEREATLRRINWLEQPDKDMVDQPDFEIVSMVQQLIQNRGGELDVILGGGVLMINGLECRDCQGSPLTPDTLRICQAKISVRVWLGHGGQWASEMRYRCNRLNIGSFTTVEDAISGYELVTRLSGWMDHTGIPRLSENANRSKLLLQLPPVAQEEKLDEDFGIEVVGTSSEHTWECVKVDQAQLNSGCLGKRKIKEKNPGGERRNKKTNGVKITIPLKDISQTKGMHLKDAANHLGVTITELMSFCREYGIQIWSPCNEHKLIMQPLPDETPAVVNQEVMPQLTSHNVPSDQSFMATVDANSVVEKEIPLTQFLPIAQQENLDACFGYDEAEAIGMGGEEIGEGVIEEAQVNSGCLEKQGKMKVNTPGGERGNNRTTGVRIAISDEDILLTKGMRLKDVANHLGDEDFGNVEAGAVGMESRGTRQSDMEEVQLNSRYLEKEKMKEMTPGGERRNKKNAISLEDIFWCMKMPQKVAAKHLKVSLSTLKRACRGHGIPSWPPCGEHNQSHPNESPAVVDKEQIPQLNSDTLLPSNQVSATTGKESVTVKARFSTVTMKFQLSWPWRMEELKQQVEKRLGHEAENYYICYKDQDNDDDLLIACDEDLQDHISHSSLPGTNSIEVFLKPK